MKLSTLFRAATIALLIAPVAYAGSEDNSGKAEQSKTAQKDGDKAQAKKAVKTSEGKQTQAKQQSKNQEQNRYQHRNRHQNKKGGQQGSGDKKSGTQVEQASQTSTDATVLTSGAIDELGLGTLETTSVDQTKDSSKKAQKSADSKKSASKAKKQNRNRWRHRYQTRTQRGTHRQARAMTKTSARTALRNSGKAQQAQARCANATAVATSPSGVTKPGAQQKGR